MLSFPFHPLHYLCSPSHFISVLLPICCINVVGVFFSLFNFSFIAWDPFFFALFSTDTKQSPLMLCTSSLLGQEDKKPPPPLPKKPAGGVSGSLRADSVGDSGAGGGGGGGVSGGLVVPRVGGHTLPMREKSLELVDRQRTEARRRLLQTKRTASFRQNSATESASDSIEIYIPEAQTRL